MRKNKGIIKEWFFLFLLIIILCSCGFFIFSSDVRTVSKIDKTIILHNDRGKHEESFEVYSKDTKTIPGMYLYRTGNMEALRQYLFDKNSNLANEPYFGEIFKQAKKFNINPCLLFAITGREQSFVPKSHKFASQISNNPFNVFGSWEDYNTTIDDSAAIACRTIIRISKSRPKNEDFFKWLNLQGGKGGYAEDKEWHKDVKIFFEIMNNKVY